MWSVSSSSYIILESHPAIPQPMNGIPRLPLLFASHPRMRDTSLSQLPVEEGCAPEDQRQHCWRAFLGLIKGHYCEAYSREP